MEDTIWGMVGGFLLVSLILMFVSYINRLEQQTVCSLISGYDQNTLMIEDVCYKLAGGSAIVRADNKKMN